VKVEWDAKKAAENLKKHGIGFEEATTIFGDPFEVTLGPDVHAEGRRRSGARVGSADNRDLPVDNL
jgi:uncharacterized DUF497 family protein